MPIAREGLAQRLPMYMGGFMGPFGTMVILPMFPELRESFDASSGAVSWGFTLYMLPFAAVMIVSGTLGERWGRRRTLRVTYVAYALASILAALAPNLGVFLLARALQGGSNAFITPLLLAALADITPQERLGNTVGVYSSFQSLGTALAPLVGGVAADFNWRWAFVGAAVAAGVLAMFPVQGEPRTNVAPPPIKPLLTRKMTMLGVAAFACAAGPIGAGVLVGVAARDELELSGSAAGVVLLIGSLCAMTVGPAMGRLVDRWGLWKSGQVGLVVASVLTAALAGAGAGWSLASIWVFGAAASAFVVVVLQAAAATAVPNNRGGALSAMLAWRFLGHAAGPAIWIAVFETNPNAAFYGSALLGIVALFTLGDATKGRDRPTHGPVESSPEGMVG